jgi:hypothetical protein
MGNRHHNKKLRAQVRARMAQTGERYQQALSRLAVQRGTNLQVHDVDLLHVDYFGEPLTVATFQMLDRVSCVVLPSRHLSCSLPKAPILALGLRRSVH